MKASINTVNVELNKEEVIALLTELNEVKRETSSETKRTFFMLNKLETFLATAYQRNEISNEGTTFTVTPKP